jgi:hypothetical protein
MIRAAARCAVVTVAVCRRHANLAEKWHHLLVDVQDPSPSKAEEK